MWVLSGVALLAPPFGLLLAPEDLSPPWLRMLAATGLLVGFLFLVFRAVFGRSP